MLLSVLQGTSLPFFFFFRLVLGLSRMLFAEEHSALLGGATESADDLLVFGYSCTLFRNDEQASRVNRGATLIPWQGDKSLMIDRYGPERSSPKENRRHI